jgi:hypothetical protein
LVCRRGRDRRLQLPVASLPLLLQRLDDLQGLPLSVALEQACEVHQKLCDGLRLLLSPPRPPLPRRRWRPLLLRRDRLLLLLLLLCQHSLFQSCHRLQQKEKEKPPARPTKLRLSRSSSV